MKLFRVCGKYFRTTYGVSSLLCCKGFVIAMLCSVYHLRVPILWTSCTLAQPPNVTPSGATFAALLQRLHCTALLHSLHCLDREWSLPSGYPDYRYLYCHLSCNF